MPQCEYFNPLHIFGLTLCRVFAQKQKSRLQLLGRYWRQSVPTSACSYTPYCFDRLRTYNGFNKRGKPRRFSVLCNRLVPTKIPISKLPPTWLRPLSPNIRCFLKYRLQSETDSYAGFYRLQSVFCPVSCGGYPAFRYALQLGADRAWNWDTKRNLEHLENRNAGRSVHGRGNPCAGQCVSCRVTAFCRLFNGEAGRGQSRTRAEREEQVTKTLSETKRLTRVLHCAGCLRGKENAPAARRFKTVLNAKQKREDDAHSNAPAIRGRE